MKSLILSALLCMPILADVYLNLGVGIERADERVVWGEDYLATGDYKNDNTVAPSLALIGRVGYNINNNIALYTEFDISRTRVKETTTEYISGMIGGKYTFDNNVNVFISYGRENITVVDTRWRRIGKAGIGYQFLDNFSLEGYVVRTGEIDYTPSDISKTTLGVALIFSL